MSFFTLLPEIKFQSVSNMSGYFEYSKSINAIMAECNGKFPASVLARKLKIKVGAIKALLTPVEWHHTSKYFNATDYYDEQTALEILDQLKQWKPPQLQVKITENCFGSYLQWSGTCNFRKSTTIDFEHVQAIQKGDWVTLTFPNNFKIKKNRNTRGFYLYDSSGNKLT